MLLKQIIYHTFKHVFKMYLLTLYNTSFSSFREDGSKQN